MGQEDELIDLSAFSLTPFPTILWLSAVSYAVSPSNKAVAGENSPCEITFLGLFLGPIFNSMPMSVPDTHVCPSVEAKRSKIYLPDAGDR